MNVNDKPNFMKIIDRMKLNGTFHVDDNTVDFLFRELSVFPMHEVQEAGEQLLKTYTYNRLPQLANWHQAIEEMHKSPKFKYSQEVVEYDCNKCEKIGWLWWDPPTQERCLVLCGCANGPDWAFEELKTGKTWSIKMLLDRGVGKIEDITNYRGHKIFTVPATM